MKHNSRIHRLTIVLALVFAFAAGSIYAVAEDYARHQQLTQSVTAFDNTSPSKAL